MKEWHDRLNECIFVVSDECLDCRYHERHWEIDAVKAPSSWLRMVEQAFRQLEHLDLDGKESKA